MDYKSALDAMPQSIPLPADYKALYGKQRAVKQAETADSFKTVFISPRAGAIWQEYCEIFKSRWGLTEEACYNLGAYGKGLASAEFVENGDSAYSTSVMQPIRNAYYNSGRMDYRWDRIGGMGIKEPVLDYGCGVGFMLLWLNRIGYKNLYGHELEGVTKRVMLEAFKPHGIGVWQPSDPIETVLCINVLEHLAEPVLTLIYLKSIGKRVIANTNMDRHEDQHVAPEEELHKCTKMLREWGTLYES